MGQIFTGKVQFLDSTNKTILTIDPDSSFVQITQTTPSGFQVMELTNTGSLSLWGAGNNHGARLDGSIATLFLGGNGKSGVAQLNDAKGNELITLNGAKGLALFPAGKANPIDPSDFSKASISLDRETGNTTIKGNLTHQQITERSRAVDQNQGFELFRTNKDGAFIVELAASYGVENPNFNPRWGSSYKRWIVFTYTGGDNQNENQLWSAIIIDSQEFIGLQSSPQFWITEPKFSLSGSNVKLSLSTLYLNEVSDGPTTKLKKATLSVRALYGSLLDF